MVVYKSPTCGCCVKWADMLEEAGFEVEAKNVNNLGVIKAEFGIARELSSCHTAVVNDRYLLEGHVPIEQVRRLLGGEARHQGAGGAGNADRFSRDGKALTRCPLTS